MTGLDKIIEKIQRDSADVCSKIITDAEESAAEILKKAKADCEQMLRDAKQRDADAEKKSLELASAAAGQRSRQGLLTLKIKAINDVIEEALYALEHLPVGDYFKALVKLVDIHAEKGNCVLILRKADIARKPEGFDEAVIAAAKKHGCMLTVCPECADIAPGVVLKYGDIEIDCTFRSLIDERREEIKEKVNEILF